MNDIYLNGVSLEEIYDDINNSFCPECAELELLHECDEWCDEYHLYCAECI